MNPVSAHEPPQILLLLLNNHFSAASASMMTRFSLLVFALCLAHGEFLLNIINKLLYVEVNVC